MLDHPYSLLLKLSKLGFFFANLIKAYQSTRVNYVVLTQAKSFLAKASKPKVFITRASTTFIQAPTHSRTRFPSSAGVREQNPLSWLSNATPLPKGVR